MSNLVATHAQKASEAEQGNHIIFFSPSLKPCPFIYENISYQKSKPAGLNLEFEMSVLSDLGGHWGVFFLPDS